MAPRAHDLHPALRPYVHEMRHYDIDGFPPGEHIGLPSATVVLVIPVGDPLDLTFPRPVRQRMDSCLSGLWDGPATIHHDGTQRGVQLELTPLGLQRLLGLPSAEVAGRAIELADVLGSRAAADLLERIAEAPDWTTRLTHVEDMLLDRLGAEHPDPVRAEVAQAWHLLRATSGTARIGRVAAEVGWSPRHLADRFAATVGVGPKAVARIMRFERSVALVGAGTGLADTAARCHYADQAHLTREWSQLSGTTPTRWLRDDVLANVQDAPDGTVEDR